MRQASRAIGQALALKSDYHVVVLRCSVPPGTTLDVVGEEIERASGKSLGGDFGLCFNPEFLREGVAVADFYAPPKTVVGASDIRAERAVAAIYESVDKNVLFTSIAAAEMVKYADNVWHATRVAFGNEIGRLCKSLGIDSHDVMNIFVRIRSSICLPTTCARASPSAARASPRRFARSHTWRKSRTWIFP